MVGVLIQLKLRLLRNSFGGAQALTTGLGAVFGLALAALGVWIGLLDLGSPSVVVDLLCLLFALWSLGWVIGPVFLGGSGGSLPPEFFASLPLRPRRLASGLLAVSFVGVGPAVTAVAFAAGIVFAARFDTATVLVAAIAMPLQLLLVVALSKVVVDLVGAAITSTARAVVSALPWAILGGFVAQSWLLLPLVSRIDGFDPALSTVLRLLPSGWGMLAAESAAEQDWLSAVAALLALAVLFALLVVAWSKLIVRRTTTVLTVRPATARSADDGFGPRSGLLRYLVPASAVGAVAAKEIRTTARDLNRALLLSYSVAFGLSVTLVPLLVGERGYLAAAGVIVALVATTGAAQLYSNDGTALWLTLMAPGTEWADVRGRQLAWLLLVAPVTLVLTVVGGLLSGAEWIWPWTLSLLPAALGGGAGMTVLASVYALVPLPDPRKRAKGAAGGDGSTGLIAWAVLPLCLLTVLPAAVFPFIGTLTDNAALRWVGVPIGIAIGVSWAVGLGRMAHKRLRVRGPELLARMRSGPTAALRSSAEDNAVPQRPVPVGKAVLAWLLYVGGFVMLVAQVGVASILAANDVAVRTWFVALYLPADLRTAGLIALAVVGVLAVVGGWLLTKVHDKPERKKFGLP
ncbi:hypothetical protein [Allokutzneria sp. NRRL B-24872]|uniref:hypothetical protein n=1 Tax=Allokutzneria sp. NRRL B-24872 TaxID=1137961 RepID=UPI000A38E952|nr:hypothetical protein [Allokutzneria sp. NRRL B-24872]